MADDYVNRIERVLGRHGISNYASNVAAGTALLLSRKAARTITVMFPATGLSPQPGLASTGQGAGTDLGGVCHRSSGRPELERGACSINSERGSKDMSEQDLDIERIEKLRTPMPSLTPQWDDLAITESLRVEAVERDKAEPSKATNKLTIANAPAWTIRCTGRLSCDCGTRIRAIDFQIEAGDGVITRVRLVCPGCGKDLFEVEAC
jgi:hypothetical protein